MEDVWILTARVVQLASLAYAPLIKVTCMAIPLIGDNRGLDDDACSSSPVHTFAHGDERIINSSIATLSNDPDDGICLTPSMLLNIKLNICCARDVFIKYDDYKKS